MRGVMLFVAGWTAGLAGQVAVAQSGNTGLVMMNHVGITVANIPEAVTDYTQKMGFTDPSMGRIELVELTPDSLHQRAIQPWK